MNATSHTSRYTSTCTSYCSFCGKGYKTRNRLEKHATLCEIIHKTKNNKKIVIEEEDEIPSQRRLYQLLLELGQKYNRLEEKVEEMRVWVDKKKKKINVIDWLNTTMRPSNTFDTFHEMFQVTEETIDYLFQTSFMETFDNVFSKTMSLYEETNRPIIAFQQKSNIFYVFEERQSWEILSREKIVQFLNRCHRKISKALSDWKRSNQSKIQNEDKYALQYDKTVSKLMSIEWTHDPTVNKAKAIMFSHLKIDIKTAVEYEFEY